jgi:hypothetical protein
LEISVLRFASAVQNQATGYSQPARFRQLTLWEAWPMVATEPEHRMAMPGSKVEGTVFHLFGEAGR